MKRNFIVICLALLVSISCTSLKVPVPKEDNETQLLVCIKTETVDQYKFFASYKVFLDNGDSFRITPSEGYLHIKSLPPGEYKVIGRQAYYKNTGRYGSYSELNIPFTLEPRTITILPSFFALRIGRAQKEGRYTQYFSAMRMGSIHREEARDYLAEFENISHWKIRDF